MLRERVSYQACPPWLYFQQLHLGFFAVLGSCVLNEVGYALWRRLLRVRPLDGKEIQPVHPKGDQCWVFIGRTDVEVETPVLCPPHEKSWLIGKDPDAGKDWRREEKGTTGDEMVGWHHWLSGHEFGWTPGVGDGQGGLACCSPWGRRELDTTEWPNWTECPCLKPLTFLECFIEVVASLLTIFRSYDQIMRGGRGCLFSNLSFPLGKVKPGAQRSCFHAVCSQNLFRLRAPLLSLSLFTLPAWDHQLLIDGVGVGYRKDSSLPMPRASGPWMEWPHPPCRSPLYCHG